MEQGWSVLPKLASDHQPPPPLGISPHKDAGFLTVLAQDPDCHSLQVRRRGTDDRRVLTFEAPTTDDGPDRDALDRQQLVVTSLAAGSNVHIPEKSGRCAAAGAATPIIASQHQAHPRTLTTLSSCPWLPSLFASARLCKSPAL